MSIEDRTRWEEKHRRASSLRPRASVLALPRAARAGMLALDVACGQGRHSAALREKGYDVIAMDVARTGLGHALRTAPGSMPVQADTDAWPFAPESFDVVVQVDFLERRLFPVLACSLRRGGLLLVDTFLDQGRPNAEGPSNPAFVLRRGELREAFRGLHVDRCEETEGETARASLLARKP
jgi:tellurite methyltransferase